MSYNTYPGWYMRGMIRDLLRRQVRDTPDLALQAVRAREFMALLARHAQPQESWYATALAHEDRILAEVSDTYIAHEHLDPVNEPLYLTDFIARIRSRGLEYLGEALPEPLPQDMPGNLGPLLSELADDPMAQDQYLDYFLGRTFHRTVLCRAGAAQRARTPVESVRGLEVRARARPVSERPSVREIADEVFRTPDGYAANSNDPLIKAILVARHREAPGTLEFSALRDQVGEMLAGAWPACYREDDPAPLAEALLRLHQGSILRLHTHPFAFAAEAGDKPSASPLTREQARTGAWLTSLRHDMVELEETERALLSLLDGTRDRRVLLEECPALGDEGLDMTLARMARHGLLKK